MRGRGASRTRALGLGLVVGPASFVSAWVVAGALTPDYEPLRDAISRTAEAGAPHRHIMNLGFLAFAAGAAAGSVAIRRVLPGPAWIACAVNAAATLGVALTPLGHSDALDAAHTAAAAIGYASLALTPLLAARPLATAGHRRAATVSIGLGVVVASCLVATAFADDTGLLQRVGLTTGDVWLVTAGLLIARGRTVGARQGAAG